MQNLCLIKPCRRQSASIQNEIENYRQEPRPSTRSSKVVLSFPLSLSLSLSLSVSMRLSLSELECTFISSCRCLSRPFTAVKLNSTSVSRSKRNCRRKAECRMHITGHCSSFIASPNDYPEKRKGSCSNAGWRKKIQSEYFIIFAFKFDRQKFDRAVFWIWRFEVVSQFRSF